MGTLLRDLGYALRKLGSARAFTATAVLTLAVGIGGTTAIFTLIHAVMLKSLPVGDPLRLYRIGDGDNCCVQGGPQDRWGMFSFPLFERIKAEVPEFEELTAFQAGMGRMSVRRQGVNDAPRPLRAIYVSGNYFTTLGVNAVVGRAFTAADDAAAATPVVVLAYHAWQGIYGGDPQLSASTLVVEGQAFTVAGVTPPGFFGETLRADPPDMWVPLQQEPLIAGDADVAAAPTDFVVAARDRPAPPGRVHRRHGGAAHRPAAAVDAARSRLPGQLAAEIERVLPQQVDHRRACRRRRGRDEGAVRTKPADSAGGVRAGPAHRLRQRRESDAGPRGRAPRPDGRAAGDGRFAPPIVTEALVESVLLAIGGALAGLIVSVAASSLLLSLAFSGASLLPIDTMPSPLVLAFATGLALVTGVLFGAAPAWFATRTDPVDALRGSGRTAGDRRLSPARRCSCCRRRSRWCWWPARRCSGAAWATSRARTSASRATAGCWCRSAGRRPRSRAQRLTALYRDIEERLARIPGVQGAGLALYNPLTNNWGEGVLIAGKPLPAPGEQTGASWDRVSANYLQQLGVKLVRGRHFTAADNETAENVAVVNEAFVRRFFKPDEDPLDQHFGLNLPENVNSFRIVGVVGDARFAGIPARTPDATDVLRAARADGELRQRDDEARRDRVALRRRAAAA